MRGRQLSAKPGEDPQAPLPLGHHADDANTRPERACTPPLKRSRLYRVQGCGGHLIYDLGIPRDIC
jgi:hypothetical protein